MTAKRPAKPRSDDPGQYLPLLAVAAANRVKARTEPLTRSEALAAAPWAPEMPAAWEQAFREAYADRLIARKLALPAKRSGTSRGAGGKTDLIQARLYLSKQEHDEQKAIADAAGLSWSNWARRKLSVK